MKKKALFVGVNDYKDDEIRNLHYALDDARSLHDIFEELGYKTAFLKNPGQGEILSQVRRMTEGLSVGDQFVFYFSGHGFTDDGQHLLFCVDDVYANLRYKRAGMPFELLEEETRKCGCDRVFMLDACRSDFLTGTKGADTTTKDLCPISHMVPKVADATGAFYVLRSCSRYEHAFEIDKKQHGLFTLAMMEVIRESKNAGSQLLFNDMLRETVEERMSQIARNVGLSVVQTPESEVRGRAQILINGRNGFLSSTTTILVGADSNVSLRPRVGLPPPVLVPDGMPFGAQVTFAETMWVGVASPVKIAFKADRDIYADVAVSVLNGDEVLYHHSHGSRPFTSEIKFSFNVCPRMPGEPIELTMRFDCNRDGSSDPDVFETMFPVCVHEKQAKNVNINTATVVTDTESDVFQHKVITASGDSIEDKRPFLAQNVTLPLEFSLAATPNRLTLAHEGGVIHIWAIGPDETIICGRDNTCDYMLRVFDKVTGELDENKSFVISGRHFRFVLEGGRTMRVADGMDSPSSWGTSVGEIDVGNDGMILYDGEYGIDIGTKYTRRGVISLDVSVTRNEDDGTLAGFTIARSDGLNERVIIIVNRSVPFEGSAFAWDGKKFLFNGKIIIPGLPINAAGTPCEVRAFHQRKR